MVTTIPPPARRLLVFARVPELGEVKTRLAAGLGDARALAVYEAMLRDLLAGLGESDETTTIEIMWTAATPPDGQSLRRAFGAHELAMQTGADLGDRLAMALSERFFFHRTQQIIAIGIDDPRLTRESIEQAFALLDSCEWVIGPATDGGYYLLGCRAPAFRSEIFSDMPWGTSSVFATTLSRIRTWEQAVAVLPIRSDIDLVEDLQRFAIETRDAVGALPELLREWRFSGD